LQQKDSTSVFDLKTYVQKDRFMLVFLAVHVLLACALTVWMRQPWGLTLGLSALAFGLPAFAVSQWPGTRLSRYLIAVATPTFTMLFIHLTGGSIEAHFHIFGMLCWLALYHDWDILAVAAAAVAVHHIVGNFLFPYSVFHYGPSFAMVLVHAAALVFAGVGISWQAIEARRMLAESERSRAQEAENTARMAQLLDAVRAMSTRVTAYSGRLTAASDATGRGANDIAHTITELSHAFQDQVQQLSGGMTDLERLQGMLEGVARHVQASKQQATESHRSVIHGQEAAEAAVTGMRQLSTHVNDGARTVSELSDLSGQIGTISTLIAAIASQTNLLALNAAIEAARAGEHGRGFAVVADEVRKLAGEARTATEQIQSTVVQIQDKSALAASTMTTGIGAVDAGLQQIDGAYRALQAIRQAAAATDEHLAAVVTMVSDLETGHQRLGDNMNRVVAGTEQSASGAHQVSTTVAQQAANVQEIAAQANDLLTMAQQLEALAEGSDSPASRLPALT
jgi:methyl-accepting chemotaxis protein